MGEGSNTTLFVPLSVEPWEEIIQLFGSLAFEVCCSTKPLDGAGHDRKTPGPLEAIFRMGNGMPRLMRLFPVSATYSRPLLSTATPVGHAKLPELPIPFSPPNTPAKPPI